jgi:transmembrane 9 superfamily protein 2/4
VPASAPAGAAAEAAAGTARARNWSSPSHPLPSFPPLPTPPHPTQLYVGKETRCQYLCDKTYGAEEIASFVDKIDNEYTVNWILDSLPAAVRMYEDEAQNEIHYERGFPLGFAANAKPSDGKRYYLFNHIQFIIQTHAVEKEDGKTVYRVVGFEVEPWTVKHTKADETKPWAGNTKTCTASRPVSRDDEPQVIDRPDTEVVYTYDVFWQASDVEWSARWDMYLKTANDDDIHWFSIMNSLMIVLFMTGMIAMIMVRNLYRDIARYNEESPEEAAEETGWKLVHGDVFRPPAGFFGPMFLSVFVGSGMQILAMSLCLLGFAVLGFLSPAQLGNLVTAFILLFVFMGSFAGYFSARLYKMFKGKAWKRNTFLTAFAFSGSLLTIAIFVNFFVWSKKSSLSIPFVSILLLVGLWLGVCAPLVAVGAYYGFKAEEIKHPVRVTNIPRQVPPQPWYLHPIPAILVGGILPFGSIFIELFFIMSAIWLGQIYLVFGFLFIVLLILVVTCAEISIVMTYFQLCSEDYKCVGKIGGGDGGIRARAFLFRFSLRSSPPPRLTSPPPCLALLLPPPFPSSLQLVVAVLPDVGVVGALPLPLRHRLLLHQARDHAARLHRPLLRLHVHDRVVLLPHDGQHRLRVVAGVRQQDLQRHQGGLGLFRMRERRGEGRGECDAIVLSLSPSPGLWTSPAPVFTSPRRGWRMGSPCRGLGVGLLFLLSRAHFHLSISPPPIPPTPPRLHAMQGQRTMLWCHRRARVHAHGI